MKNGVHGFNSLKFPMTQIMINNQKTYTGRRRFLTTETSNKVSPRTKFLLISKVPQYFQRFVPFYFKTP